MQHILNIYTLEINQLRNNLLSVSSYWAGAEERIESKT